MNYAFTKACLDYFANERFDAGMMADKLNNILMRNASPINYQMLNLLDSHDTHRFFTEIKCDKEKMLAAIALEMFFPGATCIYYGTEICIEGGYDPDSRRCFNWNSDEWDMDYMEKFKSLVKLRNDPIIKSGTVRIYAKDDDLIIERKLEEKKIVLKINITSKEKSSIDSGDFKIVREG